MGRVLSVSGGSSIFLVGNARRHLDVNVLVLVNVLVRDLHLETGCYALLRVCYCPLDSTKGHKKIGLIDSSL